MYLKTCIASVVFASFVCLGACDEQGDTNTPAVTSNTSTRSPANTPEATPQAHEPDNTANNKDDARANAKTPLDQSEAAAHIKITADIRTAIMDDKTMSMNAQNCKIITDKNGMVTLRGVVDTQAEKDAIQAKAEAVAGAAMVRNELEVKTR